jgi:hypothetical protein
MGSSKAAIPGTAGIAAAVVSSLSRYKGQVGESREFVACVGALQIVFCSLFCCRLDGKCCRKDVGFLRRDAV